MTPEDPDTLRAMVMEARRERDEALKVLREVVFLYDQCVNPVPETVERWRAILAKHDGGRDG